MKSAADPLRQDKGGGTKGTLCYTAEFIPSLNVKWEKFKEQDTEVRHLTQQAKQSSDGGYTSSGHSSSDEDDVPRDITIQSEKKAVKNAKSMESVKSTKTTKTMDTAGTNGKTNGSLKGSVSSAKEKKAEPQIVMTHEELLAQRACFHGTDYV